MRVALFGGTFDPIHRGHVAIARAAADAFALDQVLLAPTAVQPLKPGGAVASFAQRLAMVELACAGDSRLVVSELDAPRPDGTANYTVDTLGALHVMFAGAAEAGIFNLVGADSFLGARRWREPDRLLQLAEWIVVTRPGSSVATIADLAQLGGQLGWTSEQMGRVHLLAGIHEDVSSTELRERLRAGERCEDLLPHAVAEYIAAHALYRQGLG